MKFVSGRKRTGAAERRPRRNQIDPFLGFSRRRGSRLLDDLSETRVARLCAPDGPSAAIGKLDHPANNHGFYSPVDYPWSGPGDAGDAFVVGVFGGSAAQLLALQLGDGICDGLSGSTLVAGRTPVLLNCASGGMKQPQALITLNLLLAAGQQFDAVILFDGFNDAALSHANWESGHRPDAPSVQHLEHLVPDLGGYVAENPIAESDVPDAIAEHWARCSRLFHDLCRSQQIDVVQVVQPNQYAGNKSMSPAELDWAVSATTPYRRGVERVYPKLAEQVESLVADGYDVTNAMGAFDHIDETVYADNCCHYNLIGSGVIKDIVVARLLGEPVDLDTAVPMTDGAASAVSGAGPTGADDGGESGDVLYPMW